MATNEDIVRAIKELTSAIKGGAQSGSPTASRTRTTAPTPGASAEEELLRIREVISSNEFLNEVLKDQAKIQKEASTYQSQQITSIQKQALEVNAIREVEEQALSAARTKLAQQEKILRDIQQLEGLSEEAKARQIALQEEIVRGELAEYEAQLKITEELREQAKYLREAEENLNEVRQQTDNVLGLVGLSSQAYEKSFYKKAEQLGKGNIFKGLAMQMGQMAKTVGQSLRPSNLLAQATQMLKDNTIELVKAQNTALASFNKATGAGGEFNNVITNTRQTNTEFNVTIQESAAAMGSLFNNFRAFTTLGGQARQEAANLAVQFDALGVGSEVTAGLLNELFEGLQMDVNQAGDTIKELAATASELGISQQEMMGEFKASLPTLAAYGNKATEVFKKVAASSKATGIEMNKLIGITSQFDTFQGAADAVSGLNAILGGPYLNSLEMVNATEDERIRLLVSSMEATGMSFGSLSKFEQKAIAAKLGITDMAEANKLLNTTVAELDENAAKADAGIMDEAKMQQLADSAANFDEKLQALFQQFTVLVGPIIELINGVLSGFTALSDMLGVNLAPVVMGVLVVFTGLEHVMMGLSATSGGLTTAKNFLAAAFSRSTYTSMLETAQLRLMYIQEGIAAGITKMRTFFQNLSIRASIRRRAVSVAETAQLRLMYLQEGIATKVTAARTFVQNMARRSTVLGTIATYASAAAMKIKAIGAGILAKAMFGLGVATKFAMGPIGLIIGALLALGVALFVSLHSPPLYIGLALLGTLMLGLGIAMGTITPVLMAFGKAMLVVGAGIALAGAGFMMAGLGMRFFGEGVKLAAEGLVNLAGSITGIVDNVLRLGKGIIEVGMEGFAAAGGLLLMAKGFTALGLSLGGFAVTALLAIPTLSALTFQLLFAGAAMTLIANSINSVADRGVQKLVAGLNTIAAISPAILEVFRAVSEEVERFSNSLSNLAIENMESLAFSLEIIGEVGQTAVPPLQAVGEFATAQAQMTPEAAESTKVMMESVVRVIKAADEAGGMFGGSEEMIEILNAVKDMGASVAGKAEGGSGKKEIKLYMDRNGRKEFAKGIIDDLSPELNKKLSINKGPQISG